jgi:hypothetical protein
VFTYRGRPIGKLNNSAWKRGWRKAGLPVESGVRKTRKALLGHADGDITTHYSAAEIEELRQAAQRIVNRRVAQTPTLMIVRRTRSGVGNRQTKRVSTQCCLTL